MNVTIYISHQKASALCKKYVNGAKVPPKGEAYLMPHGVKLYHGIGYFVYGYAYDLSDLRDFCKENGINTTF